MNAPTALFYGWGLACIVGCLWAWWAMRKW